MVNKKALGGGVLCGMVLFFLPIVVTVSLGGVAGIMKWGVIEWVLFALLGIGFGAQIFFFVSLRSLIRSGATTAVSGASSGVAMLACCTHYLVGLIPLLGVSGLATVLAREQRTLLIIALIINCGALIFVYRRYAKAKRKAAGEKVRCPVNDHAIS